MLNFVVFKAAKSQSMCAFEAVSLVAELHVK